jgi:transposase
MPKGIKYTLEFIREAVKLAQTSDKPIVHTANKLGVKPKTLYRWISESMKNKSTNKSTSGTSAANSKHRYQELERENQRLKKDLKRAEMEREILKKAAAYFANLEK